MSGSPPAPTREYASVGPAPLSGGAIGRLGDYYLLRKLGQGGMGEIFLAKRIGVGGFEKALVLKCMLDSLCGSQEFVAMFFDEAHLAARLSHPNIAQIYDFGVADGRYYIAMEYIPGEDLSSIIGQLLQRKQQIPVALAARIMIDVCAGLEYAHTLTEAGRSLKIIHRDVSPSNVMVSYQGAVKLLDFGIAKATSQVSETRAGNIKGKLSFLAPELIRGLDIDPRADLFSLGISLFALLTKQHPFRRDSEIATMHAIVDSPAAPDPRRLRPDLPDDMVAVVQRALERDREDRFRSAAEMGVALQNVVARHAPTTRGVDLAEFLGMLFGSERRDEKSYIPKLTRPNLQEVVTPVPTLVGPSVPSSLKLAPTGLDDVLTSAEVAVPTSLRRSRSRRWLYGAVAAAMLLGFGGGLLLMRRDRAQPPEAPATAVPPSPAATVPPAPAAVPAPAPAAATSRPAPATRTRQERGARAERRSPEPLTEKALHAVVQRAYPRFADCVKRHAADLPGGAGQLKIELAVAGNGSVSSVAVALPGSSAAGLSGCLKQRALRLRFPRHPDQQIRFAFPLVYRRGE